MKKCRNKAKTAPKIKIIEKKCSICQLVKNIDFFDKQSSSKTGYRSHCKKCRHIREKKNRNKNISSK